MGFEAGRKNKDTATTSKTKKEKEKSHKEGKDQKKTAEKFGNSTGRNNSDIGESWKTQKIIG